MVKKVRQHLHHCAKSLSCVTGVVCIWYSVWWLIDYIQVQIFPEHDGIMALIAGITGLLILWLPDRDLDELQ